MRSLYGLKPRFQAVLRPLVAVMARAGVSPNGVTVGSLAMCAGCGAFLALSGSRMAFLLLPLILLLRMALNAIDGMLAREHNQTSILGARLNEIGDVLSDICLYLPFVRLVTPAALVVAVVLAGILTELAGVLACAHGGTRDHAGPFGKSDRAAFFSAIAVALALRPPPDVVVTALFLVAALAALATTASRLTRGVRPCHR